MPFNDARAGWIVAMAAIAMAAIGGMVSMSAQAGSLETRVKALEAHESSVSQKLDSIADAVARIEGRLEKQ